MKNAILAASFALLTVFALAQDPSTPPQGFPGTGADDYSYGPLGAEGRPLARDELKGLGFKNAALRVTSVFPGGPGHDAGLQVGDVIHATSLGPLERDNNPTKNEIVQLTVALEAAESKKKGKLAVIVRRAGQDTKLSVEIPYLGPHSRGCRAGCPKCDALYMESLHALAAMQLGDGSFPISTGGSGGAVVVASIAGLALMTSSATPATGEFQDNIDRAAKFVMLSVGQGAPFNPTSAGGANWNQENWPLSYAPWFLSEYYRTRPTPALKAKLQEIADRLVANMEASGGWAHGPGGPNALNYLELEIMSNFAMTALGCMRSVGIEVDQKALDRARDYVLQCTTGSGGTCYSTRDGQFPGTAEAGRTAGAFLGMVRCGYADEPVCVKMGKYVMQKPNLLSIPTGHVSPVMHFLGGALASWELGPQSWQTYWDTFRTTFRSFRQPDGQFTAMPTEESQQLHHNCDRGNGTGWITATYALIMGIPNDNLPVLLPKKKRGKPVEIVLEPLPPEAVTTGEDGLPDGTPSEGTPGEEGGSATPGTDDEPQAGGSRE